ncbi:MAG: Chromosomal replication initiator protein DnaA [Alphaproteobacteria bacterium ADurb.Bin438]|nr:MAG: Chromosomal replication initiator protein DnaA [Alphaproteobacteria bacterium ADurb.Bin438]
MTNWENIVNSLSKTKGAYDSWVKYLTFNEINEGKAYFSVPTPFFKDWISKSYAFDIIKAFKEEGSNINSIAVNVANCSFKSNVSNEMTHEIKAKEIDSFVEPVITPMKREIASAQLISSRLDANYTFENFITSQSNEFAYAATKRVAEGSAVSFNPLFLYSSVGLGKTHLLQAIANKITKESPEKKVLYLTAEKYLNMFVKAVSSKDTNQALEFKEMFRSVDVLMIDDIQFLIGKKMTLEELLYTLDELVENGKQLILSANKAPNALIGLDERLKTRMSSGLVVDIMPASFELRLNVLKSKALLLKTDIPFEVLEFLAEKIPSNIRELEGALRRVVAHAEIMGEKVSLSRAKIVLKDLLSSTEERIISIAEIKSRVATFYKLRQVDIMSKSRQKGIAVPRQIAMYMSKTLTTKSYPEIGREFDRDHTTILHGVRKIEALIKSDKNLLEQINTIRGTLL